MNVINILTIVIKLSVSGSLKYISNIAFRTNQSLFNLRGTNCYITVLLPANVIIPVKSIAAYLPPIS